MAILLLLLLPGAPTNQPPCGVYRAGLLRGGTPCASPSAACRLWLDDVPVCRTAPPTVPPPLPYRPVPYRCRYVYQKAYVEFFCSPASFAALQPRLAAAPALTYLATTASGEATASSMGPDDVNALTWGVFPGAGCRCGWSVGRCCAGGW